MTSWRGPPARALVALAVAVVAVVLPVAGAMAAAPRTTLSDVESEVMCLSCGTALDIAQSPQADRERAFIRRLVARGQTKTQVKRELVAVYGPAVLAVPPAHGFNLVAYVAPVAAVVVALGVAGVLLPRWRRARRRADALGAAGPEPEPDPQTARRLDDELTRFRG